MDRRGPNPLADLDRGVQIRGGSKSAVTRGTGNGERGTGNGEPGTGVWELMYSGNPLENSKWRSKQKKGSKRNNLGKGEFPPAVPPDGQYVIVRAESD